MALFKRSVTIDFGRLSSVPPISLQSEPGWFEQRRPNGDFTRVDLVAAPDGRS